MGLFPVEVIRVTAERWAGFVLVALLLTGGVLSVRSDGPPPSQSYITRTGEIRSIQLEDGSRVDLNTRTSLEWSADGGNRRVLLHGGEAFFDIQPDPERPFRIELAHSEIRVLGTRFNVYQKANGQVAVTVLDGKVQVQGTEQPGGQAAWERDLYANQHIEYGPRGLIKDTCTFSTAAHDIQWRHGKIAFEGLPLPEVIAELGRYTDRRIIIDDARLNDLQFLGILSTHDIPATLTKLTRIIPVTLTESGDTLRLKYRDPHRPGTDR